MLILELADKILHAQMRTNGILRSSPPRASNSLQSSQDNCSPSAAASKNSMETRPSTFSGRDSKRHARSPFKSSSPERKKSRKVVKKDPESSSCFFQTYEDTTEIYHEFKQLREYQLSIRGQLPPERPRKRRELPPSAVLEQTRRACVQQPEKLLLAVPSRATHSLHRSSPFQPNVGVSDSAWKASIRHAAMDKVPLRRRVMCGTEMCLDVAPFLIGRVAHVAVARNARERLPNTYK